MKFLLFLLLSAGLFCLPAQGELISTSRLIDWEPGVSVGVPGGIAQYFDQSGDADERNTADGIDVTQAPYNADNTGATNAATIINNAIIAAAAVPGTVIYLPPGTYKIDNTIFPYPETTLRGAGPGQTILQPTVATCITWFHDTQIKYQPYPQVAVTAGVTTGSTSITLADATAFSVGQVICIWWEDQIDNAAIQAGAIPVVSIGGYDPEDGARRQLTVITGKAGNVLTLEHPIYRGSDAGLDVFVGRLPNQINGAGVEDLEINSQQYGINMQDAHRCWIYNVKINNSGNYPIQMEQAVQCEVRKCSILADDLVLSSNHAGILMGWVGASLVEDNIIKNWFPGIEVNFGSAGNVIAYNLFENEPDTTYSSLGNGITTNHGPHNSYNLYEGNIAANLMSDGYFGGSEHDTIHRNWLTGTDIAGSAVAYPAVLKRFTRNYNMTGNILGRTGEMEGGISTGQPNLGNSSSIGEATPSTGDFWGDWKATGTLTTRTSDYAGVVTMDAGAWTIGVGQLIVLRSGSNSAYTVIYPDSVVGNTVSFTTGSQNALPAVSTAVRVYMHAAGSQELDLDVALSLIDKGNYKYASGGTAGSMTSLGGDTLPDSFIYSSKPAFFGALDWPAFDPTNPSGAAYTDIPAGVRYLGGEVGGGGGSSITTGTLNVGTLNVGP